MAGTEGAAYRRQQMDRQLPEHDQDPSKCHELSPAEVKLMQQFVRKYKDEALGVGDVLLPEEMALVKAGGQGGGVGAGGAPGAGGAGFGVGAGGQRAGTCAGSGPGATAGGVGQGAAYGLGPGGNNALAGAGAGTSPSVGGAVGTAATAGAMVVPGGQQSGLPQQNFVSSNPLLLIVFHLFYTE